MSLACQITCPFKKGWFVFKIKVTDCLTKTTQLFFHCGEVIWQANDCSLTKELNGESFVIEFGQFTFGQMVWRQPQ